MATEPVKGGAPSQSAVKLLDQVRDRIHYKHDSLRTEDSYGTAVGLVDLTCPGLVA